MKNSFTVPLDLIQEIAADPNRERYEYMSYWGNKIVATRREWSHQEGVTGIMGTSYNFVLNPEDRK